MKKIFTLAIIFVGIAIKAQVSAYVFAQIAGTYTALTVPGSTIVATGFQDDNVYSNLPIGFSFGFNNTTYTAIGLSSNGWMTLGSYFPNDNFAPISNSGGNGDAISFMAGDMQMGPYQTCTVTSGSNVVAFTNAFASAFFNPGDVITGTGIPSNTSVTAVGVGNLTLTANATSAGTSITAPGIISYVTVGVAPNRVFTMQWKRMGRYSNNGTGQDDFINAQIKLYETSNVVEIIYGATGTTNANTMPSEIGLVGQSNADYNNRDVPIGFNWQSSSGGLANNATCMFSNSNNIPNGLIYRWTPPSPCAGSPAANIAVAGSSLACIGGNVSLNLANSYTTSGLSYVWSAGNSSSGPFTPINTATVSAYTATNITTNTWFICTISCTNSAGSVTTAPIGITAVGSITNTTPYFEGFENVLVNNLFPNCSWAASNPTNICQTYTLQTTHNRLPRTGSKFASFNFGTDPNGDYFYTNGLKLYSGFTYSAEVYYITDGANGWSEFSLFYGTAQSTLGLTNIASVTGNLTNAIYAPLTNTFTVPNSGFYYIAVKAIGSTNPWFLTWDDLAITAPCNLNTPTLSVNGGTLIQCAGIPINLAASGANSYTWSTGPNTSSVNVIPFSNTTYSVSGSNIVSCIGMATKDVSVQPLPLVSVSPVSQSICVTEIATITVNGATSYTWNPSNSNASTFTLMPSTSNIYTVSCTGTNNCVASTTANVIVSLCTGIKENNSEVLVMELFPNPNSGLFTIQFAEEGIKYLEVLDVVGRTVYIGSTKNRSIEINLFNLANGIYYVKVKANNQTEIKKVIRN